MVNNIKLCTSDQLGLLRDISIETYRDTFSESNSEELMIRYFSEALNKEKLLLEFNNPDSYFYFIFFQDQAAGFLKVNETGAQTDIHDGKSLEIERFYIRKQFLRNGLGRELMDFVCTLARQAEKEYVWLGVWEGNFPALHFYKSMGFQQIGSHPFDMGGDIQTDLVLKKEL
ncbi:GNAT family N-acetyltransferase [Psychromonas ossibalaenae]|uniref:GNAT family N-acetyltransferase n=1 Tax=Psychromonas ossibalaenae TaxID=444922 RepID=UPI0003761DDC|nr:GNAT family N-acetyltransferase [Psychromonas ossibalaenae]